MSLYSTVGETVLDWPSAMTRPLSYRGCGLVRVGVVLVTPTGPHFLDARRALEIPAFPQITAVFPSVVSGR